MMMPLKKLKMIQMKATILIKIIHKTMQKVIPSFKKKVTTRTILILIAAIPIKIVVYHAVVRTTM